MKYYLIKTLMVSLPRQTRDESIMLELPNNAIPIGIEVRPVSFPEGLFIHHLIPCDEKGNLIEEVIPSSVYEAAWNELYKLFGERLEQENLDGMDAVMAGIRANIREEIDRQGEEGK